MKSVTKESKNYRKYCPQEIVRSHNVDFYIYCYKILYFLPIYGKKWYTRTLGALIWNFHLKTKMIFGGRFSSGGIIIYISASHCSQTAWVYTNNAHFASVDVPRVMKTKNVCPLHKNCGCNCLQRIGSLGFCFPLPLHSGHYLCFRPICFCEFFILEPTISPVCRPSCFMIFTPGHASSPLLLWWFHAPQHSAAHQCSYTPCHSYTTVLLSSLRQLLFTLVC